MQANKIRIALASIILLLISTGFIFLQKAQIEKKGDVVKAPG